MSDYTIGYDTAMNTAVDLIDKLRDTAQSHDRCTVVEVMGHNAGHIALNTGIACGATAILTKEMSFSVEDVITRIKSTKTTGKHHFIVVISEGLTDIKEVAKRIEQETGVESRPTILGHVQRGGSPTLRDRVAASRLGHRAVELLSDGIGNRVVGFDRGNIVDFDIQQALTMKKPFDEQLYNIGQEISF
jgi:6-phosphofructokinase 1